MRIMTKFTTDDVTPSDAMVLNYKDNPDGGDPIYIGAVLVKGGAALLDEPDQLHALVRDSLDRQYSQWLASVPAQSDTATRWHPSERG